MTAATHPLPTPAMTASEAPTPARPIVAPGALDLTSPGRRDYWVALPHDSIWGDHLLPLTVLVGPQAAPGEGLVAFGATHGDEYERPVAIRHHLHRLPLAAVRGRIVLMPMLNVPAFRAGTRESRTDDGVNLNRAFVAGAGEAPAIRGITHRIAAFVRAHLWPHVHVVIDLHSRGDVAAFVPTMTFHATDDQAQAARILAIARGFGTPILSLLHATTPGLLFSEAHRLGKIAVSSELGWGRSVQREGVRMALQGVLAAAVTSGQAAASVLPSAPLTPAAPPLVAMDQRACFHPAPLDGLFEPQVALGERVAPGTVLGCIHPLDQIDLPPVPLRAQLGGLVAAHAWGARVVQGQHVAVVARVIDG